MDVLRAAGILLIVVGGFFQAPQLPQAPPTVGTGLITGVVVSTGSSPLPIRRAIIKLSAANNLNRGAITDDNGQFTFGSLPAGRYSLSVSKPAYLTTAFGTKGSDGGTVIVLKDGERLEKLRVPLTKGAVVTGIVRDQLGDPARDVPVFVTRTDLALSAIPATVVTDDTGTYRIYGLTAGTYIVGAIPRQTGIATELVVMTRAQIDAEMRLLQQRGAGAPAPSAPPAASATGDRRGYAPVFHPSSITLEQATAIAVGAGEERRGVDISIQLLPIASISGTVIGPNGQPSPDVAVELSRPMPTMPLAAGLDFNSSKRVVADGTFRFTGVIPGSYTLVAKSTAQVVRTSETGQVLGSSGNLNDVPAGTFYLASTKLDISGNDISDIVLRLVPGPKMTGKIVFDATTQAAPQNVAAIRFTLTRDSDRSMADVFLGAQTASTTIQPDGSFEARGLTPGNYALTASVPVAASPKPWLLRSVMMGGRDLLDQPLVVADVDFPDVVVTFTDRHTELSGTLATAAGAPVSDYVIVAMPFDRALWQSTRRVQSARPATNGQFTFTDLPPGDYLVATLTDIPENWKTPDFLGTVAAAAVKVSIGEGEKKIFDLRIAK